MSNVVGSVLITLDIQDRASAGYVRAANVAARQSVHLRNATVQANNAMAGAFTRTAAAVSVLHGPLGGVASRISAVGTLARTSSASMAAFALSAGGAGFALSGFLRVADRMRLMENSLKTVTTGTSNLRDIQGELLDVSQRSRASMSASATIYARTARATEHLGLSQQKLLRITETVQKAFSVGGASTAEAQGAAIQLSQGIASDRFSGEEFRSVAENAPVLLREMGNALGVNIGKLREMAHAGELTAEVVTNAILDASSEIDRYFNMSEVTIGQAWTKIRNEVDMYVHEIDTAYGITRMVAGGLNLLAENFDQVGNSALVAAAAIATFMSGRLGAAALGRKDGDQTSGLRGIANQIGTHGLFYGVRRQAKEEANAARSLMERIKKDRIGLAEEIANTEAKSNQKLIDMRMAHEQKLASARAQEVAAHKSLTDIAARRVVLTDNLAKAQASVVQQLRLEQQEARKAIQSHGAIMGNAGRRFSRYGKTEDRLQMEQEQKNLTAAQERYRQATERLSLAQRGAFDDERIRRYGNELRKIESQITANDKAMVQAQQRFTAANAAYVAAQRQGGVYLEAANAERAKALRHVSDLENRQHDLNRAYTVAGIQLQRATRQMTLLGAAQMRMMSLARGMWGLLGGGPGVAIMALVGGFIAIQNSLSNSARRADDFRQKMVELGYATEDVAESMERLGDKSLARLVQQRDEIERQVKSLREGDGVLDRLFGGDTLFHVLDSAESHLSALKLRLAELEKQGGDASALFEKIAATEAFIKLAKEIDESGGEATNLNDRLNDIVQKNESLAPFATTLEKIADTLRAAAKYAADTNKSIKSVGQSVPAWIQDAMWQTDQERKNAEFRKLFDPFAADQINEAGRNEYEERFLKIKKDIVKEWEEENKNVQLNATLLDDLARKRMAAESSTKGLHDLIGFYEGTDKGRGYNETLDYGRWTGGDVNLTQMTLREVRALQDRMRTPANRALYGNGKGSSAVGRYQIVSSTLDSLIKDLGLSMDQQFTPELQDRLADELIRRRGRSAGALRNEWEGLRRAPDAQILGAYDNTSASLPNMDPDVLKRMEGLKDLRLDALAGQMDEFNQKIVQQAQALGVSREEIELYIRAVTTGDLQNVPAVFHEIALAMDEAANNELMRSLKDMQLERGAMFLSDIDQELVKIAQTAGMSAPAISALIAALRSGETSALPDTLAKIRGELELLSQDKKIIEFADGVANAFGDFFRSVASGSESFGEALKNLGLRIADLALEILVIQPLIESLKNSFKGGFGGGGGGIFGFLGGLLGIGGGISLPSTAPIPTPRPSFAGGGFTGYGSRSGGIDGKGGFPAILHPNETVIDHTQRPANFNVPTSANQNVRVEVEVFVNDDGTIGAIARSEGRNAAVSVVQANNKARQKLYQNGGEPR